MSRKFLFPPFSFSDSHPTETTRVFVTLIFQ